MDSKNSRRIAPGLFPFMCATYTLLITGLPILAVAAVVAALPSPWNIIALVPAPIVTIGVYLATAGLLSIPHQQAIVAGKFRRDVSNALYFHRRMFGLCWTMVYYNAPAYHAALAFPMTKKMLFWLFGYRGETTFTTYPDAWIRDIPLLSFGKNAYISNKATLGTNMVLRNGKIIVGPVTVGANSVVGHLSAVGPGTEIGCDSEIGVGALVGVGVRIGSRVNVGGGAIIEHMTTIGDGTTIGLSTFIGRGSCIGEGLRIPSGVAVPAGTELTTQADVEMVVVSGSQTRMLEAARSM